MWDMIGDHWAKIGTSLGSIMFLWTMIERFFPHGLLHKFVKQYIQPRILRFTNLYVQLSIDEFEGDLSEYGDPFDQSNQYYIYTEAYLCSIALERAMQIKAYTPKNSQKLLMSMVDYKMTITDDFNGATFWWMLTSVESWVVDDPPRLGFKLKFHKRHRDVVMDKYLNHVMEKGKEVLGRNQQRKLYTNKAHSYKETWKSVVFNHPATLDSLAMDTAKKADIIEDLIAFSKAKDYYAKIGKAWKRGYLLYGPPGTGKSTMIAAISNFMNYDIYDLELKSVKGNGELRKLLLDTSDRSIIVIEDIDCNVALTNKRITKKEKQEKKKNEEVTLSGLLNFIDGLWSSIGGERLIIVTTNHVNKLDPALLRRGRMDKHIEMGYCSFEGFKILAKKYLNIDDHPLFETVCSLIDEIRITPADVAENLMPKTVNKGDHSEVCLGKLICALEKSKEDARLIAENPSEEEEEGSEEEDEESRLKAESKLILFDQSGDESKTSSHAAGHATA